jgi:hypothetical protein
MSLKAILDTLDGLDAPIKALYTAKDGKFVLDVEGVASATDLAAANAKVVEFRDKNIAQSKELDDLRPLKAQAAKFEGIDLDAAKDALAKVAALGKKGVKDADDLNAIVQAAVQAAIKPVSDKLAATEATSLANAKRADDSTLRAIVIDKFLKAGGEPGASEFIIGKAGGEFLIENGTLKAQPNKFSATKPGEPLGVDEWMGAQTKESAFAFKPSTGGGAEGKPGSGGGGKPGQKVLTNPTPQQLGEHMQEIRSGKMRIETTT